MAYQTGSFTSAADLIATIKSFASSNGWTVSGDVISKGTVFTALTVSGVSIMVQGGTGESGGVLTGAAAKAAYCLGQKALNKLYTVVFDFAYPGSYYLFLDSAPDSIICVMKSNEGLYFNWLCFGMSTKYASYVGGEYAGASYGAVGTNFPPSMTPYSQSLSYNKDKGCVAPLWKMHTGNTQYQDGPNFLIRSNLTTGVSWLGENGTATAPAGNLPAATLLKRNPNSWTSQTILLPFWIAIERPSSLWSVIGLFPPARIARVTNHEAGDIITLGADKYMVFPFFKKDIINADGNIDITTFTGAGASGTMGWAIKYDGP